jgi:hypothetical protein
MTDVTYDEMLKKAVRAYLRDFAKRYKDDTPTCVKIEKEYLGLMVTLVENGVDKGKPFLMTQIKSESDAGRFIKNHIDNKYKNIRVWNSIHGTIKIMSK